MRTYFIASISDITIDLTYHTTRIMPQLVADLVVRMKQQAEKEDPNNAILLFCNCTPAVEKLLLEAGYDRVRFMTSDGEREYRLDGKYFFLSNRAVFPHYAAPDGRSHICEVADQDDIKTKVTTIVRLIEEDR